MNEKVEQVATTTIGSSIVIKGKLKTGENLVVRGRVEAQISSANDLRVEDSGVVKAHVHVRSAHVSGVVIGNITCEQKLEIAPGGRVVGDLLAPRIIISDGASLKGKIS